MEGTLSWLKTVHRYLGFQFLQKHSRRSGRLERILFNPVLACRVTFNSLATWHMGFHWYFCPGPHLLDLPGRKHCTRSPLIKSLSWHKSLTWVRERCMLGDSMGYSSGVPIVNVLPYPTCRTLSRTCAVAFLGGRKFGMGWRAAVRKPWSKVFCPIAASLPSIIQYY